MPKGVETRYSQPIVIVVLYKSFTGEIQAVFHGESTKWQARGRAVLGDDKMSTKGDGL
jgi:hypothetical protein